MKKSLLSLGLVGLVSLTVLGAPANAAYPPTVDQPEAPVIIPYDVPTPDSPAALIFANSHNYGSCQIDVRVYNNYFGDPTKYWWTYIVRNFTFDPNPGTSNGFSGFELSLPVNVPDIADIDPTAPWLVNCCSGLPVEWDITNSAGLGVMPTQTGTFSFTTSPRLISTSSGWFHTWQNNGQTDIVNYPPTDAPEVPNVLDDVLPVAPSTWGAIKSLQF